MTKRKQIEENRGRRIGGVAVPVRTLALLIVVAFLALVTPSLCLAQVQLPAEWLRGNGCSESSERSKGDLPYFQGSTDRNIKHMSESLHEL